MTSKWNDTRKQPFSPAGQHRSFLPPSHYAAAGGFAYPVKRQEPKTSESSWGHRSGSGLRNRLDEGTSTPKGEARVGPAESGSESSLDYRRTQSASKGQSGGKVAGPSRIQHDQRPGLPNVESELLPSLQTTINKMTRPPSRLPTISTPKAHGQSLHKPKSTPKLAGGSNNLEYHPSVPSIEARQKLPKPSLKSALRTPMQTVQKMTMSPLPPPPEVPKVPSPRTPSLRTVRSLLSRKPSTTPQQPTTPLPAVKPLNITSKSTPSNLPRPKPKLEHTPSQSTVTDESDLEKQYERQWMDKRRLTVANAEVLPSTSSSESDVQVPYRHEPWLSNVRSPPMAFSISRPPTPQPTSKANIGLGLELASESPLIPSHAFSERAKILRFSLPPSDSDASLASNRHLSYPGSWDDSDYSTGGEDGDRRGASDSAESGLEEDNSEEEQWAQDPVQWPQYQSLRRPNQKPTSWNQKPLSPRVTEQPSTPISISQLLSRRQGSYHSSPLSSPLTPKANHDFSTPRAKPERQQALSSPSRTPRANEKTSKPMVPVRSPKPKDDHTWFNESSHELENGFQAPTPRVISRKSPPSLHPKPRVTLAQETTFHAFHQRQAFGIPPSNSDEIYNGQSSKRWSEGSSQRSSVSSNTWQWDDDAPLDSRNEESSLSVGAESMLRSLSNDSKDRETETFKQSSAHQEVPRFSVVSATSTGSSMYDDHHLTDSSDSEFEDARQDYCFGDGSLQSPGERRQHHHRQNEHQHSVRLVSKRPEPANANRREVILQEFMESEETFLDNAQYCIDNFILPIRTQDRRSWIGGVPADISRLLDWYEDIVNLHMCILQTLESSMSTQGPGSSTINGLPGYLKDFVPRLHVYQPYLVRLADVLEEVAKLASNTDSDFGEFIRMQERILKPKGWTFEGLLMEPVHRLAAYQDMFTVGATFSKGSI
ncbi:hypothetical protein CC2G_004639 [Coprinopsis cinerea AmutBmut pab1-1]|nr:hypothetical protein CC2G_004639 [Coprinopsis cinerea AmutBmut pab1-1]